MPEEQIGVVVKFFSKPSVAAIEVTSGTIKAGDTLKYKGYTTEFTETVASIQMDNKPIEKPRSATWWGSRSRKGFGRETRSTRCPTDSQSPLRPWESVS